MKQNKKVIGLTGTIASGKSTAAAYFAQHCGIAVIDADQVGHAVLEDPETVETLVKTFGPGICSWPRRISRSRLGALVFNDPEGLRRLNAITHPAICRRIGQWIREEQEKEDGKPFVIVEAIELLRSELREMTDEVWVVYADPAVRCGRMMQERGLTEEDARKRIESQWDDGTYRQRAERILDGNGSRENLWRQCEALYEEYTGTTGR